MASEILAAPDSGDHDPVQSDSAGVPWRGRVFDSPAASSDDGSAPAALVQILGQFRSGLVGEAAVVDVIRGSRLLIPLVAAIGESAVGSHGHTIDKSADLSIVTVSGPDGRNVMPVFSSVEAMKKWNPLARPVPADAIRVALAAVSENTEIVVLDATSESEFVIRRPALWAVAQSQDWIPSYLDERVREEFVSSVRGEMSVRSVRLVAGDPHARLRGPELVVNLGIVEGLERRFLDELLERLTGSWGTSSLITEQVDSLRVSVSAEPASR